MSERHLIIIDFDGWNVGMRDYFAQTYLVFESFKDALDIVKHWDDWINDA